MREEILKRFFQGEIGADVLAADLDGSMVEGQDTHRHHIEDFEESGEEFEVNPKHLVSICDAALSGEIEAKYLRIIGFCIVGSDTFLYDTDTPEGDSWAKRSWIGLRPKRIIRSRLRTCVNFGSGL